MAKDSMKYCPPEDNNLERKGNSKNFHKGERPETYGEADTAKIAGGDPVDYGNDVGGFSNPNKSPESHGKDVHDKLKTPKPVMLNAVSWPNNTKMNKKDYSVTKFIGSDTGEKHGAPAGNIVGGHMEPNKIR